MKATGKQWYWSYDYPDNGDFEFDSLLVADKDLKPGQPRLLTVDNEMVVPVNKVVQVLVTGADVIHSFAVPSFGIKIDAIPGRLNDTWFKATKRACFTASAPNCAARTMPSCRSRCEVVSDAEFDDWVAKREEERRPRPRAADRTCGGRRTAASMTARDQLDKPERTRANAGT